MYTSSEATPKSLQISVDSDDVKNDGDSCESPVYKRPKDSANDDQMDSARALVAAKDNKRMKRIKRYQALGSASKSRMDHRRRKHRNLTPYDQFADILSSTKARAADTTILVEFVASIVAMYCGKSTHMAIPQRTVGTIRALIPYYAPLSEDNVRFEYTDYNSRVRIHVRNVSPAYCFAVQPDLRNKIFRGQYRQWHVSHGENATPLLMGDDLVWSDLPVSIDLPLRAVPTLRCSAILRAENAQPLCVYGTNSALFGPSGKILDTRIDVLWRQNEHLFALCVNAADAADSESVRQTSPGELVLYSLSLDGTDNVKAELISKFEFTKHIEGYTFDNAYYDIERERLIVATSDWDMYVVGRGGLDRKFREKFNTVMRGQRDSIQGAGRLFYVDEETNQGVFVGTKHIMKVCLEDEPSDKEFVEIVETKRVLKGISFQCKQFIYIYHQRTIVAMEHMSQVGYGVSHVLKVYSADFQ